jgi:Uma2 family endonuclease
MATTAISSHPESPKLLLTPAADGHARFTREAYHRLLDIGLLNEDSRVELIDGEIFMMSPIGPLQGGLTSRLNRFFTKRLADSIDCRVQLPVIVGDHSEPEPDIALVNHRDDDYQHAHPNPSDVVLLIEVAQSSLYFDLGKKLRLYAASGIREYWVIEVKRKIVLIHREPEGDGYRTVASAGAGSTIAPLAASECQLEIDWLFR